MTTLAPTGATPEGDPLLDALYDGVLDGVLDVEESKSKKGKRATGEGKLPEIKTDTEIEEIDIGPYCVDCRDDTTGQEGRTERTQETVKVTGQQDEEGDPEVVTVRLKGWLCEECQPFQVDMTEAIAQALAERRHDPTVVRKALRQIGEERIWTAWSGPLIDTIEIALGLEE